MMGTVGDKLRKAEAEIERLRAWIKRIDAINDNPAVYNVMIDNACDSALRGESINQQTEQAPPKG